MDLNDIHERILLELNKEQGQYLTHEEIDILLDRAQMHEFNLLIGNNRELPNVRMGFGKTQGLAEDLMPFYQHTNLDNADGKSIANAYNASAKTYDLPSNVVYIISARKGNSSVDILNPAEITARLDSEIIAPTASDPVAMLFQQGTVKQIQLFPAEADGVTVYYLKRPDAPSFVFTTSGREVLYDDENSTQMEWSDTAIERIIQRAIALAGVNLAATDVTQYNEQKQQTGR